MSKEEAYDRMMAHLASCQANLEQYFELALTIKRVVPYDNLYASAGRTRRGRRTELKTIRLFSKMEDGLLSM
ncbi:MAG: hypothetical protein ACLUI3_10100 [Christensenellales bacterium]